MRIGSVCSGVEGMGLGVCDALGLDPQQALAWHCEVDPAASKVLDYRFPGIPNHGDITAVDWTQVEPVDMLIGGTPCQDLSVAGKRAGMREGTRSNLWVAFREAVAVLQPSLIGWENVRGAFHGEADSQVEPCQGCVGNGPAEPDLRALGRVLGDLSSLGFDAEWCCLPASDVGACHERFRVFVLGWARDTDGMAGAAGRELGGRPGTVDESGTFERTVGSDRLLSVVAGTDDAGRREQRGTVTVGTELAAVEYGSDLVPDVESLGWDTFRAEPDGLGGGSSGGTARWGKYQPAIDRWGHALGRLAPAPTEPNTKGRQALSPRFTEWMLGLPDGWTTDIPRLTRAEHLKMHGNSCVPLQCAEAVRRMLPDLAGFTGPV